MNMIKSTIDFNEKKDSSVIWMVWSIMAIRYCQVFQNSSSGCTMNDVNPDYVVVGEGRSYSLDTLTKAKNLVLKGAKIEKIQKVLDIDKQSWYNLWLLRRTKATRISKKEIQKIKNCLTRTASSDKLMNCCCEW